MRSMSETAPIDAPESALDIESQWSEMRGTRKTADYWVMPIILLFVGFFLGPFSSLFFTAVVSRFRVDPRAALFLIGLAGTTICLVQAVTVMWGGIWDRSTTYMVRGLINFGCGFACYIVARRYGEQRGYYVSRRTLFITLFVAALIVAAYFAIPPAVLFALGR